MDKTLQNKSDAYFGQLLDQNNHQIDTAMLRQYCEHLEQKPVFDAPGWGWLGIFSQDLPMAVREEFADRAVAQEHKPYGCVLCGEEPASKYHILAGRICDGCFAMLPGGDQ